MLSLAPIDPAYTVTLFSGAVLSGSIAGSTTPQCPFPCYSEGTFQYTGAPVTSASITFFNGLDSQGGAVSAFGLDKLTYQTPEPATQMLFACGMLVLGAIGRRKILG